MSKKYSKTKIHYINRDWRIIEEYGIITKTTVFFPQNRSWWFLWFSYYDAYCGDRVEFTKFKKAKRWILEKMESNERTQSHICPNY